MLNFSFYEPTFCRSVSFWLLFFCLKTPLWYKKNLMPYNLFTYNSNLALHWYISMERVLLFFSKQLRNHLFYREPNVHNFCYLVFSHYRDMANKMESLCSRGIITQGFHYDLIHKMWSLNVKETGNYLNTLNLCTFVHYESCLS